MEDGDRTTVVLDGEVDLSTVDLVRSVSSATLAQRPGVLIVDLRLVRFIDSSGLRALVDIQRQAVRLNAGLVVVRGPKQVARVLEITALDRVLNLVDEPPSRGSGLAGS